MDANLVEKIVHEVKSQGVFDEFRKDSMADVDTKPAYQNLRQRVDNTVKKFLSEQKWSLETNKNQLREKLRRHISESGFLDVGVERIVDQVVNPKIISVFQPRIEEIAYKYLGLPTPAKKFDPPPPPLMHPLPPLPLNTPPLKVDTTSLLPTDLEQVSPDSDNATVKSGGKDDRTAIDMDTDEKLAEDEEESPPFEPLVKQEIEEIKFGLMVEMEKDVKVKQEYDTSLIEKRDKNEESTKAVVKTEISPTNNNSQEVNFESVEVDKDASHSVDARISQDSQLSSVSSDSRLSANVKEDSIQSSSQEGLTVNISEEAQMPKFSENSCELNGTNGNGNMYDKESQKSELHFDIKKDEIKFEGTERKTGLGSMESAVIKSKERYLHAGDKQVLESKKNSFVEAKEEDCECIPNTQELSFGSSIEDSSSVPASQIQKSFTHNKEKNEPTQIQTPKVTTRSITPIPTPPLSTPTTTPSPVASLKLGRDNQSRYSSSSSSKHKRHSKERKRSHEREKERDSKERHRSSKETRDSYKYHSVGGSMSTSKHSSSTSQSKYSCSQNKTTEKDIEKFSSSSTHSSTKHMKHSHSHSSSSSIENQESRKSKRSSEKRHHSTSSSSSKRNERKDDHTEAKHKPMRRKSTDSNDDGDKSMDAVKSNSQYKSSYSSGYKSSKLSGHESYKSSTSKSNEGQKDQGEIQRFYEESTSKFQRLSNVVILNDILENPQTQFIQLNNKGHLVEMPVQQHSISIESEEKKTISDKFNNNVALFSLEEGKEKENCASGLLYFEDDHINVTDRLKLLNATMDLCRSAVNSLRFDSLSDEETLKRKSDFKYEEFDATPRKRFISNESDDCQTKTSPTPSDTSSANSKENEEIHKNTNYTKKSLLDRHKTIEKLSQQQRYSSDDLYKPRPILGQRSRRRGMDSLV